MRDARRELTFVPLFPSQNAGISIVKPALELTDDDFKKVFDVNVLGGAFSHFVVCRGES